MSVVLDTHRVISYLHNPNSLSVAALQTIRKALESKKPIFVSAISLEGTVYLVGRGRLPFEALRRFESAVKSRTSGVFVQPLDEAVAELVSTVSRDAVPDMPDRIIAATLHLGILVVTRDRRLQTSRINTVW